MSCEYCEKMPNKQKPYLRCSFDFNPVMYVTVIGTKLSIETFFNSNNLRKYDGKAELPIYYCPMCGSKLLEDDDLYLADLLFTELTPRSYNALSRAHLRTVKEVSNYTKSEIAQLRNMGSKSVENVEKCLRNHGYEFKKEEMNE